MGEYIVTNADCYICEESDMVIVIADSRKEAIEMYIRASDSFVLDSYAFFQEGFWEKFRIQTQEEKDFFEETKRLPVINREELERRMREYFGDHDDWADLYINTHYDKSLTFDDLVYTRIFPDEMIIFMGLKEFTSGSQSGLVAIEINSIPRLTK